MIPSEALIDTCVIIDSLRQTDRTKHITTTLSLQGCAELISIITQVELYSGKSYWEKSGIKKIINSVINALRIIELNRPIILKAGEIRASYGLDIADSIIAASAIVYKLPFVTLNIKHFQNIKGLTLYNYSL